jgi:hypothetical protein
MVQKEALMQRLDQIELQLKVLREPSAESAAKTASDISKPTLPFQLVAIDLWNHQPYATLSHRGRLEKATVGEALAGWTVADIDLSRQQVVFRRDDRQLAQTVTR